MGAAMPAEIVCPLTAHGAELVGAGVQAGPLEFTGTLKGETIPIKPNDKNLDEGYRDVYDHLNAIASPERWIACVYRLGKQSFTMTKRLPYDVMKCTVTYGKDKTLQQKYVVTAIECK